MPLKGESRSYARKTVEAKLLGKSLLHEEDNSKAKLSSRSYVKKRVEAIDCQSRSYTRKAISKRNYQGIELLRRLRSVIY